MSDKAMPALRSPAIGRLAAYAGVLVLLAVWLSWSRIGPVLAIPASDAGYPLHRLVLIYSTLPRFAVAILCGAALGLSGALLQSVLKNPLASPATLGVSAGANLALALVSLFTPALFGWGRDIVALAGSAGAAAIVLFMASRQAFAPFALILAGLVVSLWCGALAAILLLMNDRYLAGLFIWGAGSLSQQSWAPTLSFLPKLAVAALLTGLLVRPLSLLEAGETTAATLGARVERLRFAAIAIAVALAGFVTSTVGVVGFVGLVAPAIARLAGARRPGAVLAWSAVFGALLLWLTDAAVQNVAQGATQFVPTGAVTAVIGAPLLLLLLKGMKARHRALPGSVMPQSQASENPTHSRWPWLALCLVVLGLAALFVGRSAQGGWALPDPTMLQEILALRIPRIVAAFAAGAMLAVAGVMLQGLTGNELASPEVLGISAGATAGVTVLLFIVAAPTLPLQLLFASAGAFVVLLAIVLIGLRGRFEPEKMLMTGVAISALVDAVSGFIAANGDPRAMFLLRWMSGSTYDVDLSLSLTVLGLGALLTAAALCMHRWLDILPLGQETASSLGIAMGRTRFLMFLTAGLLSAVATLAVGPLSFAGLMGPHIARQFGMRGATAQIAGGAAAGAGIMLAADWIGRTLAFPYEMPAGLVAALFGAPLLIVLMRHRY